MFKALKISKGVNIFVLSFIVFILFINLTFCQSINSVLSRPELTWTDKNEDESYVARHEFGFVQVGDKFIMFGGRESSQVLDIYDYATNSWSNGGMAPIEFNHFQAVTYEGLVWVIGAFKDNNFPIEVPADYIYMYNPASQEWIQGMEIPVARKRGANGLAVYNNKFYIVGGNNIGHDSGYVPYLDEFDPETGIWTTLSDAPRSRDHFHATIHNDKLYAIGGRLSGGAGGVFSPQIDEVDVYDFNTSLWSTLGASSNIPTTRAGTGNVLFEDEIYVIGGEGGDPNTQTDVVEAFNPLTNTWTTKSSLNYARQGIQAIVSGDGIHVAGGSLFGTSMKNMEVYGIDNPSGSSNVNSVFASDVTTKSFTYDISDGSVSLNISLSNTLGTTGTYIKSVTISGTNYSLDENYNNRLLGVNKNLMIDFTLNDTTQPESAGNIEITYNNISTINIVLEGTLSTFSVNDLDEEHSINIYPNPVIDLFSLNRNTTTLSIYNISGQLVKAFNGRFSKDTNFDVSKLTTGLYFLEATNELNDKQLLKMVKF